MYLTTLTRTGSIAAALCAVVLALAVLGRSLTQAGTAPAADGSNPAAKSADSGGGKSSKPAPSHAPAADEPSDEQEPAGDEGEPAEIDPLGPNAACYVCHTTFVHEELSKQHLVEQIGCIKCHGLSDKHANDENIGATPPDVTYKRGQIDAACTIECHEEHDVPAKDVLARFLERKLPHSPPPVCTECHGTHRIEEAAEVP